MGKIEIASLGYVFNEHILTPDGKVAGPYLGATASYAAMATAAAGFSTGLVTNIGPETPDTLLKPLVDIGVDMGGCNVYQNGTETKDLLQYFEDGTKLIEYLTRAPIIHFDDVPKDYLDSMKVMLLALVDYEVSLDTIDRIKQERPDVVVAADLGGVGGAHSTDETRYKYVSKDDGLMQKQYLEKLDIGKFSMEDYEIMYGRSGDTPQEAARKFIDEGVGMVVATLGASGSYVLDSENNEWWIPAVTPFNGVVDTTGAGDTYIAVFSAEYCRTGDVYQSGLFASATSSLLIEKTGGVVVGRSPSRKQIEDRIHAFLKTI